MNGGKARVSIPASVRWTIQNIKEIGERAANDPKHQGDRPILILFLLLPFFLESSPPSSSLPFDPIPYGERERDVAVSCEQCVLMVVGEPHQDEAIEIARQQSRRQLLDPAMFPNLEHGILWSTANGIRTVDGEVQDSEGVGLQVEDDITDEDELEVFDLRIIHRKNRTGCEEHKEFPIVLKSIVAGRYYIMKYLGSAAFSEVVQAHDLHTRMDVCLKIIKNDKDFFDQSLDEIKLLKYVNNHDPSDEHCAFMTTSIISLYHPSSYIISSI